MTRNQLCSRAYVAKEKRNSELKEIRKSIADFLFNALVHMTVALLGLGLLFGLYILLSSIVGSLLGINLLESESTAAKRWQEEQNQRFEYVIEEVEK